MPAPPDAPRRPPTPAVWLATGLGVGLVAPAPGTVGAAWGLFWAWGVLACPWPWAGWATVAAGLAVGVPLCDRAARDLGQKDPGPVVWDEITTIPLVFMFAPTASGWWLLAGFTLHRLMDITKPWPCRRLEALPGGWGVMMDDVAAALYAAIALYVARFGSGG